MKKIILENNFTQLIDINKVYFSYDRANMSKTLNGVSISIADGEFVAILGHNGSGKSTLAKHINAVLLPDLGSVVVAGIPTDDEDRLIDIRRQIGMVFQNPDNQIVATVVEEDVAFGPENLGIPQQEIRERVDYALRSVNMYEYREHAPHRLSGGQGVSISIADGEFVAILGHNGSGKSTLAKHINAVLLPDLGSVVVAGIPTDDEDRLIDIRRQIGMVFQNPDNQIVATVVEEDVAFGPENLGIPQQEIRERVDYALRSVNMYEYREHAPHRLSGGQKQRVAIAGIIAMRPKCIVLDEPTAMLDPIGRREVMKTLKYLNREYNIAIVIITHYMEEAAECQRVVVCDAGNLIMDGTPREVFSQVERLKEIGLDVPQVTELMWEIKKAGYDVPLGIISEDECIDAIRQLLSI